MTPEQRLAQIASIIDAVEIRCMAVDGDVTRFQNEVTDKELRAIYLLAVGNVEQFKRLRF